MTWQAQDKEAMQKFLRESILQLCRINIGIPGNYEVDGIICITRGCSSDSDRNTDEDQIVVKVHEQITTNVQDTVCTAYPDASILRKYLARHNVASRLIRNPDDANLPLNLKRKANDENDNAIIDIGCNDGSKDILTSAKLRHHDDVKLHCDELDSDDRVQMRRPSLHARVTKALADNLTNSDIHSVRSERYSCGSCLLDFNSWISLQGHFQQSHASCLDHYCRTCAVGFLSATDLGKHSSSVHKMTSSSAVVVSRRKQNKPRRGVANDEALLRSHDTDDELELPGAGLKTELMGEDTRQSDVGAGSWQPLLQKRPLTKMLRTDNMIVAMPGQLDDLHASDADGLGMASEHICPHCRLFFTDFSTFSVHCRAVHHRYPCPQCVQTFTQRVNRDRHLYNHTGKQLCGCSACGDVFANPDALTKHQLKCSHIMGVAENMSAELNVTDETIPFSDDDSEMDANMNDECGVNLSVPFDYSKRAKEESENAKSGFEEGSSLSVVNKQNMPKSFTHSHSVGANVRHSPVTLMTSEWSSVETAGSYQSLSSDTADVSSALLQSATESRWYSCDICRASVIGAAAFELHCRSQHRRTPCVYCGKTFSQKGNMERHQRQHTGERPFGCPHCSCSYTRKETLKVHINQAHPNAVALDATAGHKEAAVEAQ